MPMKSLFFIFFVWMIIPCWAGDGPQNSGRLTLKKTSDFKLEGTLQLDKKVLLDPKLFLRTVSITSRGAPCDWTPSQMVSNDETLSAFSILTCAHSPGAIKISLMGASDLSPGFSLGVQTPFEHFSLTLDNPFRETEVSPQRFFFFSALKLGASNQIQLAKPYALSFGGLDFLPWGIWWGVLVGSLALAGISPVISLFLVLFAPLGSGWVTYHLLVGEASLRFLTAPQLNLSFLFVSSLTVGLSYLRRQRWSLFASGILIALVIIFGGFEFAVILRWLEGNPQVPLGSSVKSFFLGLLFLNTVLGVSSYFLKLFFPNLGFAKFARIFLLGFNFYSALALAFQLV